MIYLKLKNGNLKIWKKEKFPNGEVIFRQLQETVIGLVVRYESDLDILYTYMLLSLNTHVGQIFFTYLPYSRMDRKVGNQSCSLDSILELLKKFEFCCEYIILDIHSNIPFRRLMHQDIYLHKELVKKLPKNLDFFVYYPDEGARSKYSEIYNYSYIYGKKKRNKKTGKIESLEIVSQKRDVGNRNILIIDDICSYGGTFVLAYKKLKELGAKKIYLAVTHCEDNILKGNCLDYLDGVITTNSIFTKKHKKIKVLNLFKGDKK